MKLNRANPKLLRGIALLVTAFLLPFLYVRAETPSGLAKADRVAVPAARNDRSPASLKSSASLGDCMGLLQQAAPNNPALVKSVSTLMSESQGGDRRGDSPTLMLVSYRNQPAGGVRDVVVQLFHDPVSAQLSALNPDGYVRARLGGELFDSADQFMGLLNYQTSYLGKGDEVMRQQRALAATLNGDITLLREQTVDPLHVIAVMPNAGPFLPGSLRSRVSSIVVNAELTFGEWRTKIGLVTENEGTAEQVGNVVAAWRELAVSLADTFATTASAKPLREALQATSVEVVNNQVIATVAVPARTIIRASKEITGHGGGCPPGPPCDAHKVAVCHRQGNGSYQTICVAPSAVPAHLAHGDTCGPCTGHEGGGGHGNGNGNGGGHGNNGVGNGIDPQPPGNPPVNDGHGTGPGNPGH
jgi:hypothetical protein